MQNQPAIFGELQSLQRQVTDIQNSVITKRREALTSLPGLVGLNSVQELVAELQTLGSVNPVRRGPGRPKLRTANGNGTAKPRQRAKRALLTPELKEKLTTAFKAEKSAPDIATDLGLKVPTVQYFKRKLGFVHAATA